ncbi:MAG: pseudouridine synthase [Deltaproteobacteria bacterium]|nr:pseudouridine synthase [Deltaproteobacteria bacterium]
MELRRHGGSAVDFCRPAPHNAAPVRDPKPPSRTADLAVAAPNAKIQRPKATAPSGERLQKVLSRCGVASRRAAEALITAGRVEVNGEVVTQLGVRVQADRDEIRLDGERLKLPARRVVLALNKPVGYLCAAADPENRPLVYWLVPKDLALRSVGRLDFNTEGVLLFTNDGDLAERLGHARFAVHRVYEARVRGVPSDETLARLRMGVRLEDGPARAEEVAVVKQTAANCWLRLVLLEGRNREVRRLLERVGHPVVRLRRISYAGVTTAGLAQGKWRLLEEREIAQLESKGHVGGFALPPDPRKGEARAPQLSTGPGPTAQPAHRGAARAQGERSPAAGRPAPKEGPSSPVAPAQGSRAKGPARRTQTARGSGANGSTRGRR